MLSEYRYEYPILIAIPNGGVPVAAVIAEDLQTRLHLIIARKLQVPNNPEAGFGAVTADGMAILNRSLIMHLGLREPQIALIRQRTLAEARLKKETFQSRAELPPLNERLVILVDDGLASGFTMEAAIESIKARDAERIIIAVPTASLSAYRRVHWKVDRIFCPNLSHLPFFSVASAYEHWHDVGEEEIKKILQDLEQKGL
jgi:predicted phosphoribosyltransferase